MTAVQQQFDEAFTKHQAGDIASATRLYRAVLDMEPEHPETLHMLGIIAQQMKKPELALQLIDTALAKNPQMALAWSNRATILRVLGRKEDALQSAQKALAADSRLGDAWDMAGCLLREMDRLQESKTHHEHAIELQPGNVRFHSNHTVLLLALGDVQAAYRSARISERLDKEFVPLPLGNVLQTAGYPERAIPYFRKSYEVLPDFTDAKLNEAMAYLLIGDYERGLELWESRPDNKECFRSIPRWHGEKVGHLLLHEDQGMGDALQMVRYIPLIRDRAETITLQLTGHLKNLLAANFPDINVITLDDPVPAADARVQLMSLPYICKTRLDTIPAKVPYIHASEAWRGPWRERLAKLPRPRIGLVWGGNPDFRNDCNRSLPFPALTGLLKAAGLHLVSLQKRRPLDQAKLPALGVFDTDPYLTDFTVTAGLMAELDLIISVDTACAHLAGAMNKPVWILVSFESEWRYMMGREDNPWYPSAHIFRQTKPRDWTEVMTRVTSDLQKFIAGDTGVLRPQRWAAPPLKQNPHAIPLTDDTHG